MLNTCDIHLEKSMLGQGTSYCKASLALKYETSHVDTERLKIKKIMKKATSAGWKNNKLRSYNTSFCFLLIFVKTLNFNRVCSKYGKGLCAPQECNIDSAKVSLLEIRRNIYQIFLPFMPLGLFVYKQDKTNTRTINFFKTLSRWSH